MVKWSTNCQNCQKIQIAKIVNIVKKDPFREHPQREIQETWDLQDHWDNANISDNWEQQS